MPDFSPERIFAQTEEKVQHAQEVANVAKQRENELHKRKEALALPLAEMIRKMGVDTAFSLGDRNIQPDAIIEKFPVGKEKISSGIFSLRSLYKTIYDTRPTAWLLTDNVTEKTIDPTPIRFDDGSRTETTWWGGFALKADGTIISHKRAGYPAVQPIWREGTQENLSESDDLILAKVENINLNMSLEEQPILVEWENIFANLIESQIRKQN